MKDKQPIYNSVGTIEAKDPIKKKIQFFDQNGKRNEDLVVIGVMIRKNKPGHLNRKARRRQDDYPIRSKRIRSVRGREIQGFDESIGETRVISTDGARQRREKRALTRAARIAAGKMERAALKAV